jgi:hypothetical protein
MGDYRNITKDRYRVIEQLAELGPGPVKQEMIALAYLTNEELSDIWQDIKGYELRYVGDDLFQCVEYK